jgi:ABC-type uncharacterized transport system substrate-binding protein
MWIDAQASFVFDDRGRLTAIDQQWLFDEMFSPYAMQGVEQGEDGKYTAATLDGMARDWMVALGEPISHYFTRVMVGELTKKYNAPRNAKVVWHADSKRLALHFTLPLSVPVEAADAPVRIDIYDPTYFVAYTFEPSGLTLKNAPAACSRRYTAPRELDYKTMQQLAAIPPDPDPAALPEELFAVTRGLTHRIDITCAP